MKYKIFAAFLAAAFLVLPCQAEEFGFSTSDYAVTEYTGAGGTVVIPDTIEGCPVESIASSIFYANESVESIVFPETLITLERSNIYMMDSLNSVTLPESLIVIDAYNYFGCHNVTEVTIPARVSFIGDNCFTDCAGLREIRFEGMLPVIGADCFEYLAEDVTVYVPEDQLEAYTEALPEGMDIQSSGETAVVYDFTAPEEEFTFDSATGTILTYDGFGTRVDIPAEIGGVPVTAIGEDAFNGHRYLYYVTIPEGVTEIQNDAFSTTTHLSWVEFPSTLKTIGDRAFTTYRGSKIEFTEGLESIGEDAFYMSELFGAITLPEGLKTIGTRAFYYTGLVEVYFPSTIESIGEEAFTNTNVYYLCFEGKELPQISDTAFSELNISDVDISWQASREQMNQAQTVFDNMGHSARVWRMQNPHVEYVEDGLDVYESGVWVSYTGTQSHVRPWDTFYEGDDLYDVTAVGEGLFKGSTTLEYFAVPYNDVFTTIGKEAFADSSVQTVDLFDSVTTIEEAAFRNCTQLTDLVLPQSVTTIGSQAFAGCTGLTELVLPENITSIGTEVFTGCTELKKLILPASSEYMTAEAFAGLDQDILHITDAATDEQVAAWNETLNTVWYDPIERESEYRTLAEMPYEETPADDFWYDTDYMRLDNYDGYELNLYLPRSIMDVPMEMISGNVLSRAKNTWGEPELPVKSVVIPETAKELVDEAFADCPDLEVVICYAPLETVPYRAFANCESLRQVIFVNGVRNIEENAFLDCPNLELIYLGYADTVINELAFDGEFDTACFAAELPDLDALLEEVKAEPMQAPEPEVATPIPELNPELGAPYMGVWNGVTMEMDGSELNLEEFGMSMTLWLNEDGTVVVDMSGDIGAMKWYAADGMIYVGECLEDAEVGVLQEDGTLILEEDGALITFTRGEDIPAPDVSVEFDDPYAVPEDYEYDYEEEYEYEYTEQTAAVSGDSGSRLDEKYTCMYAMVSGSRLDASLLGAEYSVTFCSDGTLKFMMAGADVPGLKWTETDGAYVVTYFDGSDLEFAFTDTGFELNFFDSMLMYFEKE